MRNTDDLERRLVGAILWSPSTAIPIARSVAPLARILGDPYAAVLTAVAQTDPDHRSLAVAGRLEASRPDDAARILERCGAPRTDGSIQTLLLDLEVTASDETPSTIRAIAEELLDARRRRDAARATSDAIREAAKALSQTPPNPDQALDLLAASTERIRSEYAPDAAARWAASARTWLQMREDPVDEPPAIVGDSLLRAGQLGMIHGRDGSRKSWALLHLATAVATGTHWFGVPMHKHRVALVSLEDDEILIRKRIETICQTLEYSESQRKDIDDYAVFVCPPHVDPMLDVASESGSKSIERLIDLHAPSLLLLDHASRMHALPDERDMRPLVLPLLRAVKRAKIAAIFVHHDRKPQGARNFSQQSEARGDSRLSAECRLVVGLAEVSKGRVRLAWEKTTGCARPDDVWLAHGDGGALVVIDAPDRASERARSNRARLLEMIREAGPEGLDPARAAAELGVTARTVTRYADELVRNDGVERVGRGPNTRYSLIRTDEGLSGLCPDSLPF